MKYPRYFLLLIVFYSLSGCALLEGNVKDSNKKVSQLMRENEFSSAISYLDDLSESIYSRAELKKKRQSIIAPMRRYEEKTLAKARSFAEQGDSKAVVDVYNNALPRLPKSSVVYREYELYKELQQRHIYELEIQALMIRARSLEKIIKIRRSISKYDPYSYMKKIKLFLLTGEIEDVAEELLSHGLKAMENGNYSVAMRTLPLALKLYQSDEIKLANKKLKKVTKPISATLKKLIESGADLYGQERYEEAIVIWQQVLFLDPENSDVKANLDRAKRVVDSLKHLKESSKK